MSFWVDVAEQVLFWIVLSPRMDPGKCCQNKTQPAQSFKPWEHRLQTLIVVSFIPNFFSTAKWS